MANLTTTGTTGYPGVLDTRTALTDGAAGDLIVANHPNGLGAAVLAIETALGTTPQGTATDVVTRLNVSQNNDGTLKSSVIAAGSGITTSYSSGVFTLSSSPDGSGVLQNVGLEVVPNAPTANALRVRLTTASGATPTTAAFPLITFHAASSTSTTYNTVTATQTVAASLSNGSTLGFGNSELGRFYIWAINANPGQSNSVIELAFSRKAQFQESQLQSTTADTGAGNADDPDTLYSQTARTNVPVRCLGYVELTTGTTAGQWTNSPVAGTLMGYGVRRTGEVVQRVATYTNALKTGTTTFPVGTNTPVNTVGIVVLWATISATSPCNSIRVRGSICFANSNTGSGQLACGVFQTATTTNAMWFTHQNWDATGAYRGANQSLYHEFIASVTAANGIYVNIGSDQAGTTALNPIMSGTGTQGGGQAGISWLTLTEVMT